MTWLAGIVLLVAAVAGLTLPWWWTGFTRRPALKRRAANVAAYRGRFRELEGDVAAAVLPADEIERTKEELAAHLLEDVAVAAPAARPSRPSRAALALAILALVLIGAGGYIGAGSWRTQELIELAKTHPEEARAEALDRMIDKLRARVASKPDDEESWAWLGRSYSQRGSYTDAARAYARASELKAGQDPDLLVAEGEAVALAANRSMAGLPALRFEQALSLAPEHTDALWYAGIAALQAGDDRKAIAYWERLEKLPLPTESHIAVVHALSQLRERIGIKPPAVAAPVSLKIRVIVAPELASAVDPQDTLFVYAQDPAGPPMPLAVLSFRASQLPLATTLDDRNAMMPARKLSSVNRWRVTARISRSGSAIPQAGDLEGSIEVGKEEVDQPKQIVIGRRRP